MKRLIEPIFKTNFLDCSYGFRVHRCAHDSLKEIRKTINESCHMVFDSDINSYLNNLNHDKLLEFLHLRIGGRCIPKVINKWLKCGVMEAGVVRDTEMGTPQIGVISPLFVNIYLHEFDKFWAERTTAQQKLTRYAYDFVILFQTRKDAETGFHQIKEKMNDLSLEFHEDKTKTVDTTNVKGGFDFLAFHNRRVKLSRFHGFYAKKWHSTKCITNIRIKVGDVTARRWVSNWDIGQ